MISNLQVPNISVKQQNITPLNVLLVDDDSDESYLFNEALEHSGLEITLSKASNGIHFSSLLAERKIPDLVFLDLNMPYKDGLETLTEIRKIPEYSQLPIVMYSTAKVPATINACYEAGADLFVIKPEDFDGLVQVVKKVCTIDWKSFSKKSLDEFVVTVN